MTETDIELQQLRRENAELKAALDELTRDYHGVKCQLEAAESARRFIDKTCDGLMELIEGGDGRAIW